MSWKLKMLASVSCESVPDHCRLQSAADTLAPVTGMQTMLSISIAAVFGLCARP